MLRVKIDGSNLANIVNGPTGFIGNINVCGGQRSIVFGWFFRGGEKGGRLWRTDAEGSAPVPLTPLGEPELWQCSQDGKWLYEASISGSSEIRRLSLANGGSSEVLPGTNAADSLLMGTALSPDGLMLARLVAEEHPEHRTYTQKILLQDPAESAKSAMRTIPLGAERNFTFHGLSPDSSFRFTPDGKALAVVVEEKGVDNIWLQPLDGSKGRQITDFKSEEITGFRWSPDGKQLALVRHHSSSEVILLRESTASSQ